MEVNNNDPNNNDVVVDEHMEEANVNMGQTWVSSPEPNQSTISHPETETIEINDYASDASGSEDMSDYLYYRKSEYETDGWLSEPEYDVESPQESDDESQYLDSEVEENVSPIDGTITVDATDESSNNVMVLDSSTEVEDVNVDEVEEDNSNDAFMQNNFSKDMPSTSGTIAMHSDYMVIRKLVPKISDMMIHRYLQRNEDHDKRLLATIWDLMHAINRPRSKNSSANVTRVKKQSRKSNSDQLIPVPGKPDVYTMGNKKVYVESSVLDTLKNRKDYKRAPKRATLNQEEQEALDSKKRRFTNDTSENSNSKGSKKVETVAGAGDSSSSANNSVKLVLPAKLTIPPVNNVRPKQPETQSTKTVTFNSTVSQSPKQLTPSSSQERDPKPESSVQKSKESLSKIIVKNGNIYQVKHPDNTAKVSTNQKPTEIGQPSGPSKEARNTIQLKPSQLDLMNMNKVNKVTEKRVTTQMPSSGASSSSQQTSFVMKPATLTVQSSSSKHNVNPSQSVSHVSNAGQSSTVKRQTISPSQSRSHVSNVQQSNTAVSRQIVNPPQSESHMSNAGQSGIAVNRQNVNSSLSENHPSSSGQPSTTENRPKSPFVIALNNQSMSNETNDFTEQELNFDMQEMMEKLVNRDIFNQLTAIFENVRREYILKLCLKYEGIMGKQNLLNHLTDVLLDKGIIYQRNDVEELQKMSLQEQVNDLMEIFPDADPEYLRTTATKFWSEPQKLKEFVQTNLEYKTYPTKEEYLKKQKMRKQLEQYITNFDVAQFLEIFPKPFEYFENPAKKSAPDLSLNYLRNHYNKVRVGTIQKIFKTCHQNLSLTVKELDIIKMDMKSKRYIQPVSTENIPFAQEVAFIRHRKEIADYLKNIEDKERLEYETLKKNGEFLECQCCFNDECLPSKSATCEKGHIFCYTCIVRGTEAKMADGDTHVKCFTNCDSELSLAVLQKVLKASTFSILLRKRQEAEVKAAGLEGLISCPFCHFASIPPAEDKVFKCLNQDCMKETCRTCKELNHVPLSCDEAKARDKARHILEEQMTKALIRICYNCKRPFFKEDGCNKMTCPCGALMCYICGQPVKDYEHFRGQGSDALALCPLYTDDKLMNAEVVRRAAQKTAQDLIAKDPNVKLETEKLMPILPTPRSGPHTDIIQPQNFPEHALRTRPYNEQRR